ncbi:MAG: hydroxymethylbilane synthase [Candidatus Eremiobacteraeota bacterium]|nr:hydroxymethylbilane synthase [Candidatus Eremiobacteraeota bacterium]
MSLPINLHIDGRLALIVGGGSVAARKAAALGQAGARLRLVSPKIGTELREFLALRNDRICEREYESGDLADAFIAIAATDDASVNRQVLEDARVRGVLCCEAGDSSGGDFSMPAVVRLDRLTFSIDTDDAAPAFSKRISQELREHFGPEYGAAARTLGGMRAYVKTVLPKSQRAAVLQALCAMPVSLLAKLNPGDAEHEVDMTIERLRGTQPIASTTAAICASRASALAMTQSRLVAAKLAQSGVASTILNITTTGDRIADRPLSAIGAQNLFVKELETALREKRADYAVHSCKDLPSELPSDMQLVAISWREDPRDAFCSEQHADFWSLPARARVGTSSPRRQAQLRALRDDLVYDDIRGNVDTRLRKLRDGDYDAVILAMAGLLRLGVSAKHTVPFETEQLVPAGAQGALAVEMRTEASPLADALRTAMNDAASELAVVCERAALRELQGGCQAPIGIHAHFEDQHLQVRAIVCSLDGTRIVTESRRAPVASIEEAQALGAKLGAQLIGAGAGAILKAAAEAREAT